MSCSHCRKREPGAIIKVIMPKAGTQDYHCLYCGDKIDIGQAVIEGGRDRWDTYFYNICKAIASKSPCHSRQIGAIIVRDKSIVSTGYNGPPRGYPHCEAVDGKCPRHAKGYESGTHLDECPATHAEANAIANAARLGVCVAGAELYLNTQIPCKDCMSLIVNAGITNVVCSDLAPYHHESLRVASKGGVLIRAFKLLN